VPDANALFVPKRRVHGTTSTIQSESIARRIGIPDSTARIEIDVCVADGRGNFTSEDGKAGRLG
jgi:hypothetical protein